VAALASPLVLNMVGLCCRETVLLSGHVVCLSRFRSAELEDKNRLSIIYLPSQGSQRPTRQDPHLGSTHEVIRASILL
jgi:hypothetical protein